MQKRSEDTLVYHSGILLLFLVLAASAISPGLFEDLSAPPNGFYLVCSVLGLLQLVFLFSSRTLTDLALASLFVVDAIGIWVLSRATGGSGSPFIFVFPLLALIAAIRLDRRGGFVVLGAALVFQFLSTGFAPTIISSLFTTLLTGSLGMYLVKALSKSDKALQESEVARRRLENLQKAILANIPSGLMSIGVEGQIIQVNGVALKILGLRENEILFKDLRSLWPEVSDSVSRLTTQDPTQSAYTTSATGRGEAARGSDRPLMEFKTKSGEVLKLGYSLARLSDPTNQKLLGSLLVFQDLTQIVKLEESFRTQEKLAAIGKLAASIAHEIRNPLAGISGSAQLLSGHSGLSEEDNKLLAIIQRESARLDILISEFLEYVRPQNPKLEDVKVLKILDQVIENLSLNAKFISFGVRVEIKNRNQIQEATVKGDANKLIQVLLNLIINSGQARAKNIQIEFQLANRRLVISDDGVGIRSEHLPRLFEPFFTTKEGGTGLGLATSFRVLEGMGARIRAQSPIPEFSPQGGGTAFTIEFGEGA